jgi:hypothetical protein
MPLINLQTDLKSIKYGQDRPGGGDSGLPYIQTDINSLDNPNRTQVGRLITKLRFTKFDDGLVRGGIIGALNASIVDTLRIGKFLLDAPKGPLFITKQVGLQLSNPKLEIKQLRTDRRGVFGAIANAANRINNTVGPTRIYNLGLNTLAQVPVNAFGGHFNRHGILPVQTDDTKYLSVVQFNNENGSNRLLGLTNKFKLGNPEGTTNVNSGVNRARNFLGRLATTLGINVRGLKPEQLVIDEYKGGPGSVYGILGSTTINRTLQTTNDSKRITDADKWSVDYAGRTRDENGAAVAVKLINTYDYNISKRTSTSLSSKSFIELPTKISNPNLSFISSSASDSDVTNKSQPVGYTVTPIYTNDLGKGSGSISQYPGSKDEPTAIDQNTIVAYSQINPSLRKYAELANQVNTINVSASLFKNGTIVADKRDDNYPFTIVSDLETIFPSSSLKNAYTSGSKNVAIDRTPAGTLRDGQNNINALPSAFKYYSGRKTIGEYERFNDKDVNSDELAVIFTPTNPFTGNKVSKKFLAYLTDYSENYDSGWNETKYVGRAESFYIFNSFKRTATIGLNIPCFNQKELTNNHSKLFALGKTGLAYALAGQYNENNLLGGVITELTLGNYLVATPGIITNFNFSVPQESPWDLNKKYAHVIKVTFQFTIIGNELPQYENVVPTVIEPPSPLPPPQEEDIRGGGGGNTPPTSSVLPPLDPLFKQTRDDRDHTYVRPQPLPSSTLPYRSRFKGFGGGSTGGGGYGNKW